MEHSTPKGIYDQPNTSNVHTWGPYMFYDFLPEHTRDLNILNAAKQMAFLAYTQIMAQVPFKGFHFTDEFYKAEANLTDLRGICMAKYMKNKNHQPQPSYINVDPQTTEAYPNSVIEFQIFDEQGTPLHLMPIRAIQENNIEMFVQNHTVKSLGLILDTLSSVSWKEETIQNLKTTIPIDVDYNNIIKDLRYFIDREENKKAIFMRNPPVFLGGNFNETDNTARSATFNSEYVTFDSTPIQGLQFQVASNTPFFTQTEAWQNWIVLKKMNIDIFRCFSDRFVTSVDLKVKFKRHGRTFDLVWTIYRYKPEKFDITHFAYKSFDHTRTLMSLPPSTRTLGMHEVANNIGMSSLEFRHAQVDASAISRLDEVKLMHMHATGAISCQGITDRLDPSTKILLSKGWVYYYPFWTVIASCMQVQLPPGEIHQGQLEIEQQKSYYITAYTIIHRTSEYATDRGLKRKRPETSIPVQRNPRQPSYTPYILPSNRNVAYTDNHPNRQTRPTHINPNIQRRVEKLIKADKNKYPVYIFGLLDHTKPVYYYFEDPTLHERALIQNKMFNFQKIIYEKFYADILQFLKDENEKDNRKSTNIATYIEKYYTNQVETIDTYPGLFLKWIKEFPKGFPSEKLEFTETAQEAWSKLWMSFFTGRYGSELKPAIFPEDPTSTRTDLRIKKFEQIYGKPLEPPSAPPGPHSESEVPGQDEYEGLVRGRDRRHSTSSRGSGRSRSRGSSQSSRGSEGSRKYRDGQSQGMQQAFHPHHYDNPPHMYSLSEEAPQISEMQHEIDSLRRSLNQLALLQG